MKVWFNVVCLMLLLVFCSSSLAQTLWQTSSAKIPSSQGYPLSAVEQQRTKGQLISLNRGLLQGLKLGETVQLPVNGLPHNAVVQSVKSHPNGAKSWALKINDNGVTTSAVITEDKHNTFAWLTTKSGAYVLRAFNGKGQLVASKTLDQAIDYQQTDYVRATLDKQTQSKSLSLPAEITADIQQSQTARKLAVARSTANTQIDVLFLYNGAADDFYVSGAVTRINHLVAVTNQIYADSGVQITLNAVAIEQVNYEDDSNSLNALYDLTFSRVSAFSDILNRRYEVGADTVVLMRPYANDGVCGVAWANGNIGATTSIWQYRANMYGHVTINCSDYVLAHELGHNMGLLHSRRQDEEGKTFHYALGYGDDSNFVTVMAYQSSFAGAAKIYKFSSPNLDCNGGPCGIVHTDSQNGADGALALNNVRHDIAGILNANAPLTSVGETINGFSDNTLKSCVSSSLANYPQYRYGGLLEWLSCSGGTINSLQGLEQLKNLYFLSLQNQQSITDLTPIAGLASLKQLYLDNNRISNVDTLAGLSNLLELTLSYNQLTNVSALRGLTNLRYLSLEGNNNLLCSDLDALDAALGAGVVTRPTSCVENIDDDGDGIANSADNCPAIANPNQLNTDGADDGGDACDSDDDNDGFADSVDAFPLDAGEWVDTDGDGIGNNADNDDDNDGVTDVNDAYPFDSSEWLDSDNDGIGNNADNDDDNDGFSDSDDAFPLDATEWFDSDGDGIGNNADNDDDNDGIVDSQDAFPFNGQEWLDSDGDGIGNNSDKDDDNDGIIDFEDAFPFDPTEWLDSDFDGIGNNADEDDDNDGVPDTEDAFPFIASEWLDTDEDGIGNNKDDDDDNDGINDEQDVFPLDAFEWADNDGDGIGNNADSDDDNDGMPDAFEQSYGLEPLNAEDALRDFDADGVANLLEYQLGTNPTDPSDAHHDSDGDGYGNFEEIIQGTDPFSIASMPNNIDAWIHILLDVN